MFVEEATPNAKVLDFQKESGVFEEEERCKGEKTTDPPEVHLGDTLAQSWCPSPDVTEQRCRCEPCGLVHTLQSFQGC